MAELLVSLITGGGTSMNQIGLILYPERSVVRNQYPNWRRMPSDFQPEGLKVFEKMVNYATQGV